MYSFDELFRNFKMNYFFKNPIYFKILSLFEIKENKNIFCEIRCGKNIIEYNPNYLEDKSKNEIQDLLITELNRIILRHPFRKKPENCDESIWYEASNITIKQDKLEKYKLPPNHNFEFYYEKLLEFEKKNKLDEKDSSDGKNPDASSDESSDGESDEDNGAKSGNKQEESKSTSRENEKELEKEKSDSGDQAELMKESSENGEKNDDENVSERPDLGNVKTDGDNEDDNSSQNQEAENEKSDLGEQDNSLEWKRTKLRDNSNEKNGPTGLWGEDEVFEETINQIVYKTFKEKSWGKFPNNIIEQIKIEYKEKLPNYRKLMEYLKNKIAGSEKKYTRTRPNRRYGFLQMGCIDKPRRPSKLLIFVDSSGSVDNVMLKNFFETIKYIFMKEKFIIDLFFFDIDLKTEKPQRLKKSDLQNFTVIGRGGTSFDCIFEYLKSNGKNYDGVIIFTDGGAPEVKLNFKPKTKVCWVLYNSDGLQHWMKKIGLCSVMSE